MCRPGQCAWLPQVTSPVISPRRPTGGPPHARREHRGMMKIAEKMQRKPVYQTPGACASESCSSMGWLNCTWQDKDRQRAARPQAAQQQLQVLAVAGGSCSSRGLELLLANLHSAHQPAIDSSCGGSSVSHRQGALRFKAVRQLLCQMQLCCLLTTPQPNARPTQSDPNTATAAVNLEPTSVDGLRMRRPGMT